MKKNVASQKIGAQMVSATDGSAFTGSVTVAVTGDAGTQATGSVGAGACTHEGGGYHTYAPAQAETNYDLVAFTFSGTGAVPATIQVFTAFPQTGDNYARLGAPAGASVSADVAAIKTQTAAIEVDTAEIGAAGAGLTALATAANLATVAGYLDTEIAAILADTNELQTDWVNGGRLDLILDARASQTSVDTIDGIVDDILVDTAVIGAAGAGLTALATQASVNTIDGIVDSILDDTGTSGVAISSTGITAIWAYAVEGSYTAVQYMRGMASVLFGKSSGLNGTAPTFRDTADTKARVTGTVDASGNRSAVTLDLT